MSASSPIRTAALLRELRELKAIEPATTLLLRELLTVCERTAHSSRYRRARIPRAVLHLRPQGAYQGVFVLASDAEHASIPDEDPSALSSATAWRHVRESRRPFAVDIQLKSLVSIGASSTVEESSSFEGRATLALMRHRETTHLLVLPLVGPGAQLLGQISLEAHCQRAVGTDFIWTECVEELQLLVDLFAPWLVTLPLQRIEPGGFSHPELPVVGTVMAPIVRHLRAFARTAETILLLGETGTGKTRLAKFCHVVSSREPQPFVVVDLNAVPRHLQQAELFGWHKGAFTGATRRYEGAVQRAAGGTLFLDEIDKLDLEAQAALLRLLEDGSFHKLGGDKDDHADVRFVIGTNASLEQAIEEGRFLRDLYYRINVLPVRLPPLRKRAEEIDDWAAFMVERRGREDQEFEVRLQPDALGPLQSYDWPGNLRQLDNVIRRAFALALVDLLEEGTASVIELRREHLEQALRMEQTSAPSARVSARKSALKHAAQNLIGVILGRWAEGEAIALDLVTGAFSAHMLFEAIERAPSVEDAFAMLDKSAVTKSRNHRRVLRAAKEQIAALDAVLGD